MEIHLFFNSRILYDYVLQKKQTDCTRDSISIVKIQK